MTVWTNEDMDKALDLLRLEVRTARDAVRRIKALPARAQRAATIRTIRCRHGARLGHIYRAGGRPLLSLRGVSQFLDMTTSSAMSFQRWPNGARIQNGGQPDSRWTVSCDTAQGHHHHEIYRATLEAGIAEPTGAPLTII